MAISIVVNKDLSSPTKAPQNPNKSQARSPLLTIIPKQLKLQMCNSLNIILHILKDIHDLSQTLHNSLNITLLWKVDKFSMLLF